MFYWTITKLKTIQNSGGMIGEAAGESDDGGGG